MKSLAILVTTLVIATQFLIPCANAGDKSPIQRKLKDIIIDHMEFEEVTIPTIIKFLQTRSKQLDPEKKGVNILPRLSTETNKLTDSIHSQGTRTVTMVVDNIPLGEAIEYICKAANLKYRVEEHAVIIASQDVPLADLQTRIYPIEQEAVSEISGDQEDSDVRDYFMRRGITFPGEAKVVYDNRISRLIATNTPDNLEKLENILREINVIDPQVWVGIKTVRLLEKDYQSLKKQKPFTWKNILRSDKTEIISASYIVTQNGLEAVVRMITEKRFPESWGGGVSTDEKSSTVIMNGGPSFGDASEIGQILRVTPNVDADHYTISLDLNPVLNAQIGWTEFESGNIKMPEFKSLSTETTITTYDGESVLLNSKIKTITDASKSKNIAGNPSGGERRDFRVATFLTTRLVNPDGSPIRNRGNDPFQDYSSAVNAPTENKSENKTTAAAVSDKIEKALDKRIDINFDKVPMTDICHWLAEKLGVPILLKNNSRYELPKVSMNLTDIPIKEVLRYLCVLTRTKYVKTSKSIVIGSNVDEMETRFFKVRAALISSIIDKTEGAEMKVSDATEELKSYYSDRGVSFPSGATIAYDRRTAKLIVKNTSENLKSLESLLRDMDVQIPLVKGEVRFVEISEKDLRELLGVKVPVELIPVRLFDKIINSRKAKIIGGSELISSSGSTAIFREVEESHTPHGYASAELVWDGGKAIFSPPIPEFGDQRDLGLRFEFTPTVSPNNYTIDLSLHSQITKLMGWTKYPYEFKSPAGDGKKWTCDYKMPDFGRCDAITSVKVYDGETVLIARIKTPTPKGSIKFPFFDDKLFSRQLSGEAIPKNEITVKNLFIFVTARLINNDGSPIRQ